jgi:predicted dehydrogenase
MADDEVRFGVLGAARIAPLALLEPAARLPGVRVTRVAARQPERARAFALEHGIPGVSASYAELVEADDVDVVYNPLPISLHAEWTIAALRAGKHVLCEKPFASNAIEAAEMVAVAVAEDRVLGEAFHYRYHPLFTRLLEVVASGVLGSLEHLEAVFNVPVERPDIRWDYATGGGSLMDLGCYPVSWVRHVTGSEPVVESAEAVEDPERVDASISAQLRFPSGATATVRSSMTTGPEIHLAVVGSRGRVDVANPLAPQLGNNLVIQSEAGHSEGPIDAGVTYQHMLRDFVDHVVHGLPYPTQGVDSVANMTVIDAIYQAAGLPLRGL